MKNNNKPKLIIENNLGLEIKNLRKSYKSKPILRNINLKLNKGEAVAVLGPNGAGKTTCFYSIAGLISVDVGEIILDGRDCGTVIAPEADLKIYMTASLELRAKRRHTQMQYTGKSLRYEDVYNELKLRDKRDMERDLSPLMKADEAVEVDSTNLSLEETINIVKKIIFSKLPYLKIKI